MRRQMRRVAPPQADRRRKRDEDDEAQARSWSARRMEPLDSLREFRRVCISRSISDGERIKYINKANECINRTGGISFWHQLQYIKLVQHQHVAGTMHNALGAFAFYRKIEGMWPLEFHEHKELMDVIMGISVQKMLAGKQAPPRGALSLDMLQQLVGLCLQRDLMQMARGFLVAWSAALRHSELEQLMLAQVRIESGGTATLRVPKKRTMRQRVMRKGVDYHARPVSLDRAVEILKLEMGRGGILSRRLFPGWSQRAANQLIHLAAKRFAWDEDFKWDGAHTLRHGATEEAAERAAKMMRVLQVTGGWDSTSAPLGYAGGVRGKPPGGGVWPRQPLL